MSDRISGQRGELVTADANGVLPLHIAVWHKAPRPVINTMLSAAPEAKNMKTNSGYYALDYGKLFNAADVDLLGKLEVSGERTRRRESDSDERSEE